MQVFGRPHRLRKIAGAVFGVAASAFCAVMMVGNVARTEETNWFMFAFAGYGVVGFGIMALEQWQEWPKGGEPAWTHSFGALFWAAFGAYQAVALTYQLFVTDPADPDRGHVLVRVSGRPGDAAAMTSSGHGGDRGRKPMRRILLLLIAVSMTAVLATPAAAAEPTITFENPPTGGVLELAVGETHVFDVTVTSDESFVLAIALTDQFYPGRGVFFAGSDRETQSTSADLHLTIRGKEPTDFLPDGLAPAAIVVGVRYQKGVVVSARFDFLVRVS